MQEHLNWKTIKSELLEHGFVKTGVILKEQSCNDLIKACDDDIYRSIINMQRYNFGPGEYKYFAYPLPSIITKLRECFYNNLSSVAREWSIRLKTDHRFPKSHAEYIKICNTNDQHRSTPLILKYGPEDYNCLHQDLYGDIHFPYQAAIMLNNPEEYEGGEFILAQQRPRQQSVPHVRNLQQGEAIIFAVNEFPKQGEKSYHRAKLRHGVSKLHSGQRHTLGIILHDAK